MKINSEDKICLVLKDSVEIYSNLEPVCGECFKSCLTPSEKINNCPAGFKIRRRGLMESSLGKAYYCAENIDEHKSSKLFKSRLAFYLNSLKNIETVKEKIDSESENRINRLVHNLRSLNGKNIQEIHALLPDIDAYKNYKDRVANIEKLIAQKPKEFALALSRIQKNDMAMKAEFSVYNKLFSKKPLLSRKPHPIKRALLSVLHVFTPDLNDKNVYVNEIKGAFDAIMDYETFQVAMYHFFDNATKYTLPNTYIDITLVSQPKQSKINIEMVSIKIEDSELGKIYENEYSGIYARISGKSGKGIGMGLIRTLLEMNNIKFDIARNFDGKPSIPYEDAVYCSNRFTLEFH